MSLKEYKRKRDFKKTPEPTNLKSSTKKPKKLIFVIQKHAASHLHYDFRLELEGVLKSWAVPKGPSLDPQTKRLAIQVEDHPLKYATFKGRIPKGQYGAGTVEIWDKGNWEPIGDPKEAYHKGHLDFILHGEKLSGLWHLVRTRMNEQGKFPWLLMKSRDNDPIKELPQLKPQLATLTNQVPMGDEWAHEVKYDGYRFLTYIHNESIKLVTRNGNDWTEKFPELCLSLKKLNLHETILDGEIIAIDDQQKISFQQLTTALSFGETNNLVYFIFDLPFYLGNDLRKLPLLERKTILKEILKDADDNIRYSDHLIGNGDKAFEAACALKLEGIISKKIDSPYESRRTKTWLKSKCIQEQEFVIIGYTVSKHKERGIASLLLAYYDDKHNLEYCGHVGTGFTQESMPTLIKKLASLKQSKSHFKKIPDDINQKLTVWVKPKLLAQVKFLEWSSHHRLRHPVFLGLRVNKKTPVNTSERLSNRNKILFPKKNISKGDLADYYEAISSRILPHIINRPLMVLRCPNGQGSTCFHQKHYHENMPKGLYAIKIKENQDTKSYLYIKDAIGLAALAQLAVIEIHPWGSNNKHLEQPDRMIFDLDPASDVKWKEVILAAKRLRNRLLEYGLQSFVKVSGQKGLHIVVPLKPKSEWEVIKEFSHQVAEQMVKDYPNQYIATMSKTKRSGKIFIDYFRNMRGSTAVSAYSCRANNTASVSLPIRWSELNKIQSANIYDIKTTLIKLSKSKKDPWDGFFDLQQEI